MAGFLRTWIGRLRRFGRNDAGNVAITFGLALIPVVGLVGAGVDYSRGSRIRAELLAAADAASVGAVSKNSKAMAAAGYAQDGSVAAGVAEAINMFKSNIAKKGDFKLHQVKASVTKSGAQLSATVDFKATISTTFMGLFGKKTLSIDGSSSAATGIPAFIDFYLLLDNTPSMGVGATYADIDKMVANTSDKCAFACHDLSDPNNYYNLAKKLGVTMRIDVLRTATQKLLDTAAQTQMYANQFRMGIYTFGASAETAGLTTISSVTGNLTAAKSAASAIDLMTMPYQNYKSDTQTNYDDIMQKINGVIPTGGNGTSASPLKYLFFVSDGVADEVNPPGGCQKPTSNGQDPQTGVAYVRCQQPINLALCNAIKARGINIAVLYTTYLPLPTNDWYNKWIAPFSSSIGSTMQACASPGFYFEVSPNQGIAEAMIALFQKAVFAAHLTK